MTTWSQFPERLPIPHFIRPHRRVSNLHNWDFRRHMISRGRCFVSSGCDRHCCQRLPHRLRELRTDQLGSFEATGPRCHFLIMNQPYLSCWKRESSQFLLRNFLEKNHHGLLLGLTSQQGLHSPSLNNCILIIQEFTVGAVHLSITCSPCEVCHIAFIFQHHGGKKRIHSLCPAVSHGS